MDKAKARDELDSLRAAGGDHMAELRRLAASSNRWAKEAERAGRKARRLAKRAARAYRDVSELRALIYNAEVRARDAADDARELARELGDPNTTDAVETWTDDLERAAAAEYEEAGRWDDKAEAEVRGLARLGVVVRELADMDASPDVKDTRDGKEGR